MPQVQIRSDVPEALIVGFARCHQLETWLREMVYLETKAALGLGAWTACDDVLKRANARGIPPERSQARNQAHPHMATPENDHLWFISFDALLKILLDDQLWPLFAPYLTTKHLLAAKLEEVALIRNRVAHVRGLHAHDLDRLLLILRELDPGIFRFCASYGDDYRFQQEDQNAVLQHFREHHAWNREHVRTDIDLKYVLRPSIPYQEAMGTGKGRLYHYIIYRQYDSHQYFDYQEIFRNTQWVHQNVAHLIMDADQRFLHVTIPAVLPLDSITQTIEHIYDVCANSMGRYLPGRLHLVQAEGEKASEFEQRQMDATHKIFDDLALDWPHYVIPPSHAYAILDSSCTPCTMFAA